MACGALAGHVREIVARRGWPAAVTPLPAVLHNRPQTIVTAAERAVVSALASGRTVALAYADCGTYGALDELCARYGVRRLPGLHCYDVFGGADRIAAMFDAEPGTYVLTDFLLRSFDRLVLAELGLPGFAQVCAGADLSATAGPLLVAASSLPISASEIRRRAREGRSLAYRLPDSVVGYIRQHHLYRSEQR